LFSPIEELIQNFNSSSWKFRRSINTLPYPVQQLISQLVTQETIRRSEALKHSREKGKKAVDVVKKIAPSDTPSKQPSLKTKPVATPLFSPPAP
jgi:hypothetical protein